MWWCGLCDLWLDWTSVMMVLMTRLTMSRVTWCHVDPSDGGSRTPWYHWQHQDLWRPRPCYIPSQANVSSSHIVITGADHRWQSEQTGQSYTHYKPQYNKIHKHLHTSYTLTLYAMINLALIYDAALLSCFEVTYWCL